jgi:hypothetical protein
VTDREVWPRLKFDQTLSVINIKNISIEILASQTIEKKSKKIQTFFKKIINSIRLCRRATPTALPSA